MGHRLLMDYRDGIFFAACSCGGWTTRRLTGLVNRPTKVHEQIELEYHAHVVEEPEVDESMAFTTKPSFELEPASGDQRLPARAALEYAAIRVSVARR